MTWVEVIGFPVTVTRMNIVLVLDGGDGIVPSAAVEDRDDVQNSAVLPH
jgi:hypothetical protein